MRKIIIVVWLALLLAYCNDEGWDELRPIPKDTIVQPDSTIVDTTQRV